MEAVIEKPQQDFSFNEEIHEYRDGKGIVIPSVTQILAHVGIVNYSDAISAEVLERKSKIGTAVHQAINFLLDDDLDWSTVDQECVGFVVAAEKVLADLKFKAEHKEFQGIAEVNRMRFGFRMDAAGYCAMGNGKPLPLIIEWKCTTAEHPSWALQTAAYELALPRPTGMPSWARASARLNADGSYRLKKYDDARDRDAFLQSLYLVNWGQNRGLYKEVK